MAEYVRIELESGDVVCERCLMATNPRLRFRGLLGKKELPPGEGILLRPCASVHTMFMRFAIDVVFCDGDLRVLSVAPRCRSGACAASAARRSQSSWPQARRFGDHSPLGRLCAFLLPEVEVRRARGRAAHASPDTRQRPTER